MTDGAFLSHLVPRQWSSGAVCGIEATGLFLGKGANALEVAVARSPRKPNRTVLLESWNRRRGRRAAPVLIVALWSDRAALCGASGVEPPVYTDMDRGRVERLCREALDQPDRHAALRFLAQALPSLETALPGLNNEGLLALHELQTGVPARTDWSTARPKALAALGRRDDALLKALGFRVERIDNLTYLLRGGDRRTALAVLLREGESPEAGNDRFNSLSPVSYALKKADDENLPWVVLTQGSRLRLYATATDAGVGRRGRTETYIECQPSLLADEQLPYLWLLYSADALAPEGSLHQILEDSRRFAGNLAERLRERIYDHVVPPLARGIAAARGMDRPTADDLAQTYEMALMVLFRLLFIAYAEDRDLLPYRTNDAYRRRSLKQKAQELAACVASGTPVAEGDSHWTEAALLWRAVAVGNSAWGVPAYDGGLFTDEPGVSAAGAALATITLRNEIFEPALRHLLVIETPEGAPGPVDFRSLGVREFGTIYEGLLESELALADTDLVLNRRGAYAPARGKQAVAVPRGEVYLHNRSGARKSSGSYYTKPFAVEHLLDGALEPALTDHFARLDVLEDTDAAEAFFDFRVADIAMGSGHFLIGAIDRIERRMAKWLADRRLPGVRRELAALRDAARTQLADTADTDDIEDGQLLRRLIARRCIYGVDLSSLSVQLARLAVWIHTFVPGLPLSFLDHNLVRGNALVGVGSIDDIAKKFGEATGTLFAGDPVSLLGAASKPLRRLARINDTTLAEVAAARAAAGEAREAVADTESLCDLIAAQPISGDRKVTDFPFEEWDRRAGDLETREIVTSSKQALEGTQALHFPVAFPEVFLRTRPGFDVILGNPPWKEATVEEHAFWARHFPGLRGLSQREQEALKARLRHERADLVTRYKSERQEMERVRQALVGGAYPGMETGDPDLYKAFCWRFWHLTAAQGGRIGVVLPRSALAAKGSTPFRQMMFERSARLEVTMLLNRAGWVFDDAEHRYTIGLVCVAHGAPSKKSIRLRGPFASQDAFHAGVVEAASEFEREEVLAWNDTASLPLLPDPESVAVFAQMRKAPRLDMNEFLGGGSVACPPRPRDGCDSAETVHGLRPAQVRWRARPDAELHATAQKNLMTFEGKERIDGYWPVYKGESFDIWNPDTGVYYAWADAGPVLDWLQRKRLRAGKGRRDSPHGEFPAHFLRDPDTLPCFRPRIAFRDATNRTNQRTVIACLVPPRVFIGNQAPYLLWPRGDERDEAYLLGVLCSIPLDWYARRFVETHVNYFVFNPFPVPRPSQEDLRWQRIVALAGRLACPDDRFSAWADAVRVACGPLTMDEKEDMIHELDAVVARLYGLEERQLVHVFETFHEGWDYDDRLAGVRRHFRAWGPR